MSGHRQSSQNLWFRVVIFAFLFIAVFLVIFKSFNDRRGYWEIRIGTDDSRLALTIRLAESEKDNQSRRIVFKDIDVSDQKLGTCKLPDEVDEMPDLLLTFQDTTLRPGRVTFELHGHEIDIMKSELKIDGKKYIWESLEPIEIVD